MDFEMFECKTEEENPHIKSINQQRLRNSLTLAEKVQVIREHELTPRIKYLAEKYNCGKTQIQRIIKNKDEYLHEWEIGKNPNITRRSQSTQMVVLNLVLYIYIKRCLASLIPLNDEILKSIAKQISKYLEFTKFVTTSKWLHGFKQLCGFRNDDLTEVKYDPELAGKSLKIEAIIEEIEKELNINLVPIKSASERDVNRLRQYYCKIVLKKESLTNSYLKIKTYNNENENEENNSDFYIELNSESESYSKSDSDKEELKQDCSILKKQLTNNNNNINNSFLHNESVSVTNYEDALKYLKLLENFTLMKEDIRAIGLVNQLEIAFKERIEKENSK